MGGMSSLTGGGGLSNSSPASAGTGDQSGGNFTVGNFNGSASGGPNSQQMLIAGVILVLVGGVYVLSSKKRGRR